MNPQAQDVLESEAGDLTSAENQKVACDTPFSSRNTLLLDVRRYCEARRASRQPIDLEVVDMNGPADSVPAVFNIVFNPDFGIQVRVGNDFLVLDLQGGGRANCERFRLTLESLEKVEAKPATFVDMPLTAARSAAAMKVLERTVWESPVGAPAQPAVDPSANETNDNGGDYDVYDVPDFICTTAAGQPSTNTNQPQGGGDPCDGINDDCNDVTDEPYN
ncbi:MAG: hypothetical protein UY05_C0031G0009 [Candidatus Peregrinibacteria bacterium GW2011_GWA2_47_7]|nr:MAG: hypothetical protein UY05_C0031G0009 [Candidatus Peregrinibacteria bacterium GW2011_GWA2_47_7]